MPHSAHKEWPLRVPPIYVHSNVSKFVLNGADLMAPGLQGEQYGHPESRESTASSYGAEPLTDCSSMCMATHTPLQLVYGKEIARVV
eukprot:2698912-Amphidinium_carterae.1